MIIKEVNAFNPLPNHSVSRAPASDGGFCLMEMKVSSYEVDRITDP